MRRTKKILELSLLFILIICMVFTSGCAKGEANKFIQEGDKLGASGNFEGALAEYQKALEVMPSYDKAKQKVEEAKTSLIAHYLQEKDRLIKEEKPEEAIDIWYKIVKLDPGKSNEAEKNIDEIRKIFKQKEANADLEKAINLIEKDKNYKEGLNMLTAITDLKEQIELSGEVMAKVHYYKGLCLYNNKEDVSSEFGAKDEFETAVKDLADDSMKNQAEVMINLINNKQELQMEYERGRQDMKAWLDKLQSKDVKERIKAYTDLSKATGQGIAAFLVEGLKDEDGEVRGAAVKGLAKIKDPRTVWFLYQQFTLEEDEALRIEYIKAIEDIKNSEAIYILKEVLKDKNETVVAEAVKALADISPNEGKNAATEALKNENEIIKIAGIKALGELSMIDTIPTLTELLKSESKNIRKETADALGTIGDKSAVDALKEALKTEKDNDVKKSLEKALKDIK